LLAEIGIILLLFEVGLETDLVRLARSGWKSIIVAIGGFVLPFAFGFLISYGVFGLSLLVSLFIGGTLTATSIGITVRVLSDLKVQNGHEGQVVLGAAVLDDVFGVILLALLYEFAVGGGVNMVNTGKVFLFVGVFFALAPVAAKIISIVIKKLDRTTKIPGLIPTTMISLVLFFGWLSKMVGAPEMLGGFAAGLALSRRFFIPLGATLRADPKFAQRIEEQMKPIIHLFTPIFFVMVGVSLNLREIDWSSSYIWGFSLTLFLAAVAGKFAGAFVIKEPWNSRFIIGVAMIPRGEVGLIFAELGRVSGVLDNETYAALIIVIVLTTVLPPFVMKWFYNSRYGEELKAPS
ncbi:MAG TPA: cation:proton antiporter, partial [Rhodospirillales bacterium]|nr:cation:proton antiporter [Rhodospirillales bacterium]